MLCAWGTFAGRSFAPSSITAEVATFYGHAMPYAQVPCIATRWLQCVHFLTRSVHLYPCFIQAIMHVEATKMTNQLLSTKCGPCPTSSKATFSILVHFLLNRGVVDFRTGKLWYIWRGGYQNFDSETCNSALDTLIARVWKLKDRKIEVELPVFTSASNC